MRWLAAALLGGCSGGEPVPDPTVLPQHAEAVVLLAAISDRSVTVQGTVISQQYVDLDAAEDGRHAFRYALVDDAGRVVYQRSTPGPVLVRTFLEHWSGVSGIDILGSLPTLGRFAVQVPLLDGANEVVFELREKDGSWRNAGTYDLSNQNGDDLGLSDVVTGFETLHESGPASNRLDLVIVGDGYPAERQGEFRDHARQLERTLLRTEPFKSYADYINIHRVDVVSAERGASYDCIGGCAPRDTAFGSIFAIELVDILSGSDYNSRAIFQALQWEVARAVSVVPWDQVLVLVDSQQYGGMAVHVATVTTGQPDWQVTGVHELGHTIGLLGDEYVFDDCIVSDAMGLPGNITDTPRDPPWSHWIEDDTPLPTPDHRQKRVGAFEGAYNCVDLYRPRAHCMMRDNSDFCEVCAELLVRRFFRYADPVDDVIFDGKEVRFVGPRDDQPVDWFVDGAHQGTSTSGKPLDVRLRGDQTLTIQVREQTPFVRVDDGDLSQELVYAVE